MSEPSGCPCESLGERNEKARESPKTKTGKETKDKSVVGKNGTGEGTTVSSACYQKGSGTADQRTAHNSQKALANADNGFEPGQDADKRKTGESNLCEGSEHKHDTPYNQKSAHTEARLLDGLGKREGGFPTSGTLTLKIDWRPNGEAGGSSPMPCRSCHKILCAAKKCGVDVFLCDENNEKKELTDEHCPADKPDSYEELERTMTGADTSIAN